MSQRSLKLNMLITKVSIFFPCPQSYFPFSVNDRTSTLVPQEINRESFWTPFLRPPPNTESWQFYSLSISASAPPLRLHPAGSWQAPNWPPCFWTHFPFPPDQGSAIFVFCKGPGGEYVWPYGPKGLHHSYSVLPLQCENSVDNTQRNELGCVPTKLYLWRQVEGQICPRGHNCLAPALHWGQSDLSERQVESYLLSYLKTLSASSSVLRSSQSPVDLAPCQLSHWTLYYAPCIICNSVSFAVTTCPLAQKVIYIVLLPGFWGCSTFL